MLRWTLAVLLPLLAAAPAAADPQAEALYQSALAKYAAKDYQGTVADAEGAARLDPRHWQAWQLDGNARYALGDTAGALTVYKYALQLNPDNAQLKSFIASLEGQAAAPAAAAVASGGEASYQAAVAKYSGQDYDGAMQRAAEAVRADPNHWQAWQLLGNARYARGDKRGALEAYDRSLSIHPDNPQIRSFADGLRAEVGAAQAPGGSVPQPAATETPSAIAAVAPRRHGTGRSLSVGAGVAMPSLKEVKDYFEKDFQKDVNGAIAAGGSGSRSTAEPTRIEIALTGRYALTPSYGGAFRLGYGPATALTFEESLVMPDVFFGTSYEDTKLTLSLSTISVMGGGWYEAGDPAGFHFGGSLLVGVVLLNVDYQVHDRFQWPFFGIDDTDDFTIPLAGNAIGVEIAAEAAYSLTSALSVFVNGGYLLGKVPKAKATKDADLDGDGVVDVAAGEALVDDADKPIPFDFSGLQAKAGIRFGF